MSPSSTVDQQTLLYMIKECRWYHTDSSAVDKGRAGGTKSKGFVCEHQLSTMEKFQKILEWDEFLSYCYVNKLPKTWGLGQHPSIYYLPLLEVRSLHRVGSTLVFLEALRKNVFPCHFQCLAPAHMFWLKSLQLRPLFPSSHVL